MRKVPAIKVIQGKDTFFLFKLKASELFNIVKINQRIEGKEEGYQRVLSPGRVKSVARYIKSGGLIPGAIVVSFSQLKEDAEQDCVILPINDGFGWIIDGQHRLAGAYEAAKDGIDIELPIVGFVALTDDRQIELFITINREAKNVPSSLYLDLLNSLPKKKTEKEQIEQRITDIARSLNGDDSSVFFQRIIFTRTARAGEISLTNFARVVRPLFQKTGGTLSPYTLNEQIGVINNYYRALINSFPRHSKGDTSIFFRTVGFGAVWRVFPFVFNNALSNYKASNVSAFTSIFSEVSGFNFDSWNQYGTGTAAENQAGEDLLAMLQEAFSSDDNGGSALKLD